jgi:hypothetical protein
MHQAIYEELKRVAQAGSYTTYSDIAPLARLNMDNQSDRNKMGEILGEISVYEHQQDRPLLSVVVIHRDDNMPGLGFFNLARELGVYKGKDDFEFFIAELRRVHDHWKNV